MNKMTNDEILMSKECSNDLMSKAIANDKRSKTRFLVIRH